MNIHINFNGNAFEAMNFYKGVFGGDFSNITRFKDIASEEFPVSESEAEKIGYVLDYRIEDIEFIALKSNAVEPQKSWFLPGVSNESFMVYVKYSVKTTDEGKKYQWLAGNGEDSPEGWVLNKTLFVTIDKYNSVYKVVNAGTSP